MRKWYVGDLVHPLPSLLLPISYRDDTQIKLSAEIEALKARAEERKLQKLEMKNHAMLELGEADVAIEGDSLPVPVMALDWDQAWD